MYLIFMREAYMLSLEGKMKLKYTSKKKRYTLTILLSIVLTLLLAPIYTNNHISGSILETRLNNVARVDIFNAGTAHNRIEILETNPHIFVQYPNWCRYNNGQCTMLEAMAHYKWNAYTVKFKIIHDGLITIGFRGPDKAFKNARFPIIVDYKNILLNNNVISSSSVKTWHDAPYNYSFKAKNGDIISVSFKTRRHHLRLSDFLDIYQLNFHLLFCIFIISFLISYKLVQYISRFKITEKTSVADIIFICIFFILLVFPMTYIHKDAWLSDENRGANQYIPLFANHHFNLQYGPQLESWFNDHFNGRRQLMRLNTRIQKMNRVISNKLAIFDTHTNWIFNKSQTNQIVFPDYNQPLLDSLENFHQFLSKNGISFYLFIVPSKTDVYAKYVPGYKKIPPIQNEEQINFLQKNASFPVIFPLDELIKGADKDFVFFKTEHHWTEWGAYIGYKSLVEEIQKDFNIVSLTSENDYTIFYDNRVRGDWDRQFGKGQTFQIMNLPYSAKKLLDTTYKYYTPKKEIYPQITDIPHYKTKIFNNTEKNIAPLKVFLAGTSMNENLLQFLPYSFREVLYYRLNNVQNISYQDGFKIKAHYENDILKHKPDIFILSINSENIPELLNLMKD